MKHPTVNETIVRVSEFHQGQVDKLGAPYYFHPMRVMMRLGPAAADAEKHAALLHDAIEDNPDVTPARLRELGYSEDVLAMIELVTRRKPMSYNEFIDRIVASGNQGAMRIKLADLYDNTNGERLNGAPEEVREKLVAMAESRYKPAIAKLKLALGSHADSVVSGMVHV
jgi:(p)ppGpp synthase/HD superfamily hydrolase